MPATDSWKYQPTEADGSNGRPPITNLPTCKVCGAALEQYAWKYCPMCGAAVTYAPPTPDTCPCAENCVSIDSDETARLMKVEEAAMEDVKVACELCPVGYSPDCDEPTCSVKDLWRALEGREA